MAIELPDGVELVRTTPEFTEDSVPPGLLAAHQIAVETWGQLVVTDGQLGFVFEDDPDEQLLLSSGESIVISPQRLHRVIPCGSVRFVVEFYR